MKYSDYKKLLKHHELRITDCRIDVLERFYNSSHALSFKYLEDQLHDYDRVTLYRTLHAFVESGLLHQIPNDSGATSYGLCTDDCSSNDHIDNHVHFKCNICGNIDCLSDHEVPDINLPDYGVEHVNVIVDGVCKSCKRKIHGE